MSRTPAPLDRRTMLRAAGALGLGALGLGALAGCGTSGESAAAGARTVDHKFGRTAISGTPSRVVTVGLTDQDYAIALGTVPVGVRDWFGDQPGALWPWARLRATELAPGPLPTVLPVNELNLEQIAALRPDLVLGASSGLTPDEYRALSGIAPTVAQPAGFADYGAPWQKITEMAGTALGVPDRAAAVTADVQRLLNGARDANPGFRGRTALLASVLADGSYYVYAEGPAPRFLVDLGFTLPPATARLFGGPERAPQQLSREQLGLLEADVLLVGLYGDRASRRLTEDPVLNGLRVVREGRVVAMPENSSLNGTLSFGSVLSLPAAVFEAVPRIVAALDGDPATRVAPALP